MSTSPADQRKYAQLRLDAEVRLKKGTAPSARGGTLSADALAVLFQLASNPETAAEGLKLLHELQTHQVELDLQYEQLLANEREFAHDLASYKALYDFAPVGYFIVDADGIIIDSNQVGAILLGRGQEELCGSHVIGFVAPASRPALADLLKGLQSGGLPASCTVPSDAMGGGTRLLRITASIPSGSETILMVVTEQDHLPDA